jgi:hypothetical protein
MVLCTQAIASVPRSVRSGGQIRVWLGIHICIQSWLVPRRNHLPEVAVRRGELGRLATPGWGLHAGRRDRCLVQGLVLLSFTLMRKSILGSRRNQRVEPKEAANIAATSS